MFGSWFYVLHGQFPTSRSYQIYMNYQQGASSEPSNRAEEWSVQARASVFGKSMLTELLTDCKWTT